MFTKHKFRAVPTEVNGRKYASKLEAKYAELLAEEQREGVVLFWLEQVPFRFKCGAKYVCDFQVFYVDGSVAFVEVKGMETPAWKLKHAMMREEYPWVDLVVVRKIPKAVKKD